MKTIEGALITLVIICCVTVGAFAQSKREKPILLEKWDPGFGPHIQTSPPSEREARIRKILDCPDPHLVCCDPCDVCVCESAYKKECPKIMLMDRRMCKDQ